MAKVIITSVIVVIVLAGVITMRLATRNGTRRGISASLVKLYGLLSVAGFALLLAWSDADATVKAGAFTLFGTIAGFLAGANLQDEPSAAEPETEQDPEEPLE